MLHASLLEIGRPCTRRSIVTGLSVRCQSSPSTTHSFRCRGRPGHNLIAIDRDLVANSRDVSVVVTQEPAQPLATLYSFVTTSFRDLRKPQDVGLPLMISLSVIMRNVFAHRPPKRMSFDKHCSLTDLTQRSERAFKFRLSVGSCSVFTWADSMIAGKEAVYFVSRS